jgi:hypothetical protein
LLLVSEREQTVGGLKVLSVEPRKGDSRAQAERAPELAFEAFGVPLLVTANRPELLDHVRPILPPGWQPCEPDATEQTFTLLALPNGTYGVAREGKGLARGVGLDLALELLDSQLRLYLGESAPDAVFVHAGVVAHKAKAIVLPGPSFAGKTTLVAALVRAGATYYSDEFAVLDERGLVHPYAKPLSIRSNGWAQSDHPVESLGGIAGQEALPVGAIVVTSFRPGAEWKPRRLSAGEGALALLGNAVPVQERPSEVMRSSAQATRDALVIESERGEADAVAPLLLAELDN